MQLDFWHWWVLAALLLALETFAPGTVFLWMGVAAGIVGVILLLISDLTWQVQGLLFAVLAVISALGGRYILKRRPIQTDEPALNKRGTALIGRVGVLEYPVHSGIGKLRLDDTMWRIVGPDLNAGTRVRIIGVDGSSLKIEPIDKL